MKHLIKTLLTLALFAFVANSSAGADRIIKITAEPMEAAIYVDNAFAGNGFAEFTCPKKKNTVVVIRIECEGYRTVNTKFYGGEKRESVSFKLVPDAFVLGTESSGIVNKFFTIAVDPKYYTEGADGVRDTKPAWKLLHQILLNYFEEIETTDYDSGFVQTPWHYSKFSLSERQCRNRVTIRDISSSDLVAFQVKVSSEVGVVRSGKHGEFTEIDRVPKDIAPLIQELQTRIGKLNNF